MVVVMGCPDCGRGYSITDFRGERDRNGARPLQCPHCYALVGHTSQDASESAWGPTGPGQ
jgi:hypothetical protein